MTPELPIEFLVLGIPMSSQASSKSKQKWMANVSSSARAALPFNSSQLICPLAITIFIFPNGDMQGDLDNRAKPILDALIECVYDDDDQIDRLVMQRFRVDEYFRLTKPSNMLSAALEKAVPTVYVRVTDNLYEELI